jgi:hypothetical protein
MFAIGLGSFNPGTDLPSKYCVSNEVHHLGRQYKERKERKELRLHVD